LRRLTEASPEERPGLILVGVRGHAGRILGLAGADALDPSVPLIDMGLDSLMSVDLKNRIEADFAVSLPVGSILEGPSCEELADLVAALLDAGSGSTTLRDADAPTGASDATPDALDAERLLADIDRLADDEVDALLLTLMPGPGIPS
jgi:hypothetical protein